MKQRTLAYGLDEQRVLVRSVDGARARGRQGAEALVAAGGAGEGLGEQAALGLELGGQPRQRAQDATSANAAAAASTVRSTCSGRCASEGNQASNCDGGG
jgi:hypothetical protein